LTHEVGRGDYETHVSYGYRRAIRHKAKNTMNEDHTRQLIRIALTGVALMLALLIWWGSIAPPLLGLDVHTASRYSGFTVMMVLIGSFVSTLFLKQEREQRIKGYIIFWFMGSLFFDFAWEVPLWTIPAIHEASQTPENLWWAIFWWSYSLSDTLYEEVTPIMISFEIWWLF